MNEKLFSNDEFTLDRLPHLIDISALSIGTTENDIQLLAETADKYGFIAAYVMPCYIEYLKNQLVENSKVIIGAPIGFPTGTDLSQDKVFQTKEMMKLGCTEFDMVICVSKLKSKRYDYVQDDIARVMEA